ncbi:hypothetical protein PV325_013164 [Microctonus aethiopoides]|nr:hypothetical protein PV325_013164 [Microctonus aethiopoides]
MSDSDVEKNYTVVKFLLSSNDKNLFDVDLVPSSWISQINDKHLCRYPDQSQYHNLPAWLETYKLCEDEWEHFPVEIISQATKCWIIYNYYRGICIFLRKIMCVLQ